MPNWYLNIWWKTNNVTVSDRAHPIRFSHWHFHRSKCVDWLLRMEFIWRWFGGARQCGCWTVNNAHKVSSMRLITATGIVEVPESDDDCIVAILSLTPSMYLSISAPLSSRKPRHHQCNILWKQLALKNALAIAKILRCAGWFGFLQWNDVDFNLLFLLPTISDNFWEFC